jgi:hypothetical protein
MFQKLQEPSQSSRRQEGYVKKVPYGGPTNNRHHYIKFSCHGDLVFRICAPLSQTVGPI